MRKNPFRRSTGAAAVATATTDEPLATDTTIGDEADLQETSTNHALPRCQEQQNPAVQRRMTRKPERCHRSLQQCRLKTPLYTNKHHRCTGDQHE
ncbi:hypothetical protein M5D96_013751 [Drosophila gunungcola]|uniref:Uncharacterized protein n=1 Tax=Drosophila gunungcola TaxID=103775 RepID=A0A9P9YAT9_9MUSC|nr:hypothetical protein M5D96_013751 [Drosophila gunungcola]